MQSQILQESSGEAIDPHEEYRSVSSEANSAPSQKVTVGAVVLNWENFSATVACINSLLNLENLEDCVQLQIIVCDNQSKDDSANKLKTWIKDLNSSSVEFLATGANGGYAYGNNRGIEFLESNYSPKYIWILNNDVEVDSKSLKYLLDSAEQCPEVLIWGSTLVDHDNRNMIQCGGGYTYHPATSRITGNHSGVAIDDIITEKRKDFTHHTDFDYISGAAMFCQAIAFQKYGLLTEDYFLYYEEHDFIKRIGGQRHIAWCAQSVVYHVGGLSTADSSHEQRSSLQQYYENLSTLKFTYRFYKSCLFRVLLLRLAIKPLLFAFRKEWHLFSPFFRALRDFHIWRNDQLKNSE